MLEQDLPLSVGDLIQYYISEENGKLIRDKVKLSTEKGKYDIKYYLENQIIPAVENILQVFNVNIKK